MRTQTRPRRYVGAHWLFLLRPVLRFSKRRDAFVLRGIGSHFGPVLRAERRYMNVLCEIERRRVPALTVADGQPRSRMAA